MPDGVALRGQVWSGNSGVVVLLHDMMPDADLDQFTDLIPCLRNMGLKVITVDQRGYGLSDGVPTDVDGSTDDLAQIVCASGADTELKLGVVAVQSSCLAALALAERVSVEAMLLVSPRIPETFDPKSFRGGGASKLIVYGGADPEAREAATAVRNRSIGWAVSASIPTERQGQVLLREPHVRRVNEWASKFFREQFRISSAAQAEDRRRLTERD